MTANRKKALLALIAGILIAVISFVIPSKNKDLLTDNNMVRNEFGEGTQEVSLVVTTSEQEIPITYSIEERIYTEKEITAMMPQFVEYLEETVLGENPSPDAVSLDLNYTDVVEGYPFVITWSSDHSELIGTQGNIKEEIKEAVGVTLTAEFEYETYIYEHSFPIVLIPKVLSPEEEQKRMIEEALEKADMESRTEAYLKLPSKINGIDVKWSGHQGKKGIQIAGFCIVISILFFFADSVERKESKKRRLVEISEDYPEFALKCSMLIGAGMTMRQIFEKIGKSYVDFSDKKKMLYEEVLISLRELESGVAERQVYENFGRRCGIRETEKFGNLMSRNLRKGTDGFKNALRREAEEAMEMKKEQIRRRGETAGTRLLFPMLILLLIVMVIIMVPAFSTFNI